jgi:hypothetical protein
MKSRVGKDGLGLELASHGEGRNCLEEGDRWAPLAGRREVDDVDLSLLGNGRVPTGSALIEKTIVSARKNNHPGAREGAACKRRGTQHRHGGIRGSGESEGEQRERWRREKRTPAVTRRGKIWRRQ